MRHETGLPIPVHSLPPKGSWWSPLPAQFAMGKNPLIAVDPLSFFLVLGLSSSLTCFWTSFSTGTHHMTQCANLQSPSACWVLFHSGNSLCSVFQWCCANQVQWLAFCSSFYWCPFPKTHLPHPHLPPSPPGAPSAHPLLSSLSCPGLQE